MVVRTYFDKNNTIIYDSYANTAKNPITELYYGGDSGSTQYTRFLIHFDTERLKTLYTGGTFTDLGFVTHTLRMINTGALDKRLLGSKCNGKDRTTSFDLGLYPINQYWDEGIGYDYENYNYIVGESAYNIKPSNWFSATTLSGWTQLGVISGNTSASTITTQHFQLGNENIEMNITNYVNGLLTGNTNNGIMLAYTRPYELLETINYQYVGFFTRHTQSIYEPFVETIYSQHILDDRNYFYLGKNNQLFLYVNVGGTPTNLDAKPTVTIYDNDDNIVSAYTQSAVTHVTKGVYSITANLQTANDTGVLYTDKWSGLTIGGITRPVAELSFEIKPYTDWFNISDNDEQPKRIAVNTSGIQMGEKIKRGDIRKVITTAKIPYTVNQKQRIESFMYRLYVKEGKNELTIIDFQPIEIALNHNYFLIDTESLLPETYYVDIKAYSNQEVSTLKEVLYFDVVSQSELRTGS